MFYTDIHTIAHSQTTQLLACSSSDLQVTLKHVNNFVSLISKYMLSV